MTHEHHHNHTHDEFCPVCGMSSCRCHHDRDHDDGCGCGHDHTHEHDHHQAAESCGCGHDHEHAHDHGHDHDHGECSDSGEEEQSHSHDHEGGCCGGHDHEHEHNHDHGHDHGHEHSHEGGCCGGHDHEENTDIPTRSHTHFVIENKHVPGHADDCECLECHPHAEYCDVCGESLAKCNCKMPDEEIEKRVYILEGIDCANCAAKIEAKIRQMPEVAYASVAYATKQLRVSANNQDELFPKMQAAIDAIEDGITLVPRKKRVSGVSNTKVYILEGLDCANCAAKIEQKVSTLDGVDAVTVTYATLQMKVSAKDPDALVPTIQAAIDAIEDGIKVVPKNKKSEGAVTRTFILEGLDCANCAAKIEMKLSSLSGVDELTVAYATKQMKVTGRNVDAMLPVFQSTIDAIEDGITVVPKDTPKAVAKADAEPKKEKMPEEKKNLLQIIVGAVLFAAGFLMAELAEHGANIPLMAYLPILIIAYIVLGGKVLYAAYKNCRKGQIFDENFLMCIATLGAFAIQEFPEAVGVMLFYRIGEYFEDRATAQSRSQIMDAVDMRPEVVNLVVGDEIRVIDAEEANVGDIVLVRPGDRIPLDGIVIEGESRIDTSPVTGEPVPVKAGVGDSITSGCVNTSGQLKVRVEKVLEESMVTRILDSVENAAASKPAIDKFITKFARIYTPLVVLAAVIVAVVLPFIIPSWHFIVSETATASTVWKAATGTGSILTALTFLVISCPCALVLSVPLAFFSGIGAGSKKGILFKGGIAIESLSAIKAVVMDKTGTITKGNFAVQEVVPALDGMSADELLAVTASCEMSSTHPIGTSIINAAKEKGMDIERPSKIEEIAGHGIKAETSKGTILCGNRKLMDANNVDMSAYKNETFGTEVLTAVNGKFAGHIVIADTLKDDAIDAISKTKKLGIITAMLTGDAQASAENVAKQTGIDEVHAKLLPQDKLSELTKIREAHGSVMFVGDGINDAPVLAGADVGAAMGSGADAAIEAADVVFMTSEMNAIPTAIDIAKATKSISWQNVWFALIIKFIVMVLGLCGFANMWLAVLADTGVSVLCLLNSFRILKRKF